MVVWFAHVRVGHRQLPIPNHPPYISKGVFALWVALKDSEKKINVFITDFG
ncbi:hypothetical protein ENHYD8BJ_120025 [Enhydrobacter sp. 8BJ]|nr:hypothetical protein ENHYD8BJ_120025 [Enhydrobacter sp. 8BJ]